MGGGRGEQTVDAESISTNKLGAGPEENGMQITRDQEGVAGLPGLPEDLTFRPEQREHSQVEKGGYDVGVPG